MPEYHTIMTDPVTGRVAVFREQAGTRTPESMADPNSAINAPLNNVASHFSDIFYHSDCNQFEVIAEGAVDIDHAAVSSASASSNANKAWQAGTGIATHTIASHGIGARPFFALVVKGSDAIAGGTPVQTNGQSTRFVTPYATDTIFALREFSTVGVDNLPATTISYDYLIFNPQPSPSGNLLVDFDPETGVTSFAYGRFRSDRKYLQVAPAGSPFALVNGKTIDLDRGDSRIYSADGSHVDANVSGLRVRYGIDGHYSAGSTDINYAGTYTGPATLSVQTP